MLLTVFFLAWNINPRGALRAVKSVQKALVQDEAAFREETYIKTDDHEIGSIVMTRVFCRMDRVFAFNNGLFEV